MASRMSLVILDAISNTSVMCVAIRHMINDIGNSWDLLTFSWCIGSSPIKRCFSSVNHITETKKEERNKKRRRRRGREPSRCHRTLPLCPVVVCHQSFLF
uniref:Uncharacterized protein n=1 Tax=Cucumis melo TaxID=3656 RepID=A0A9I9DMB1_CUCME